MAELQGWENFYVIVGSSAGALIGLQFILITLIAQIPARNSAQAGEAFATPTIVHFGAVLLLAATASAPWHSIAALADIWGVLGISGVGYAAVVAGRMRRQNAYRPELEDWLFHVVLPSLGYAGLVICRFATRGEEREGLFGVAAIVLLLLVIGIHNAWDAATYHVFVVKPKGEQSPRVEN